MKTNRFCVKVVFQANIFVPASLCSLSNFCLFIIHVFRSYVDSEGGCWMF